MASTAHATTIVYGVQGTNLYEITDFTNWTTNLIGSTSGVRMADIAIDSTGANLYGVSLFSGSGGKSELYSINPNTASITAIGNTGVSGLAAIVLSAGGTMYATDVLNSDIYTINTSTGVATLLGTNSGFSGAGGLAFVGDTLYMTGVTAGQFYLYTVNTSTGIATVVDAGNGICTGAGNTGTCYKQVYGLADVNGVLEAFTGTGFVLDLNTTTGLVTGSHSFSPGFDGATSFTSIPSVPEPGVLSTSLLGLFVGAFFLRKRISIQS